MKTKEPLPEWSASDRESAEREGWNLFDIGSTYTCLRIKRDDRQNGASLRNGRIVPDNRIDQVFKDDRAAQDWVNSRAREGSDLHLRAVNSVERSPV